MLAVAAALAPLMAMFVRGREDLPFPVMLFILLPVAGGMVLMMEPEAAAKEASLSLSLMALALVGILFSPVGNPVTIFMVPALVMGVGCGLSAIRGGRGGNRVKAAIALGVHGALLGVAAADMAPHDWRIVVRYWWGG
jgi:hypothetical protein